jgi:hypothetical protein
LFEANGWVATSTVSRRHIALLLLITVGAVLVHGYHPTAEDGELYLPGVKKDLQPALYPFNDEFFMSHARATLFGELVAASVRLSHLPFDYVVFLWHLACIFALLFGCWRIARICFRDPRAPWGSVALVAALLTIPVAGTALYIMDQYLSPRDLSTAAIVLILADALERRFLRAGILIFLIATIHPLMSVFGIGLVVLLYLEERRSMTEKAAAGAAGATAMLWLPVLPSLGPVSGIYRQILDSTHSYFLVVRWQWYEWVGIVGPLALLWWTARYGRTRGLAKVEALSRALIGFGLVFSAAGLLLSIPRLAGWALLQPMRCLHLVFILLLVLLGGVLAESVLKSHVWRWVAVLAPLCLVMFIVQRQLFPATGHLELPGTAPGNPWVQAFAWVRDHTPTGAVFALDPGYMGLTGEDEQGFRAVAERSAMANIHDAGVVSMFPALARDWSEQVRAQQGWKNFQLPDFQRLRREYGVTWVVLQRPGTSSLACPYQNGIVSVCRIE